MLSLLPASKWNFTTAAHLLNRAGFGGTPHEIERLAKLGPAGAVASLVDYEQTPDPTPDPAWAKPDPERMQKLIALRQAKAEERQQLFMEERRLQWQRMSELRGWWLDRMAKGPRPLQEKLTLFWHGHFATSVQKVRDAYLMWLQNDTFRRLASGNWTQMLVSVTKDPAMLIWLDQAQSRRQHPNENYAREVMELFALGEGHYNEKDVTEAARAFTGLGLNRVLQTCEYRPRQHDDGIKSVLGRTGNLAWSDVLEQIVAQPQAARFISAKLWRFFASENPSEALIAELAARFRQAGNDFKPLLRAIFLSEEFYDPAAVRAQVKSPVQWLVGSVRMLECELPPPMIASRMLANLGQDLFAPPNVKGWDGGTTWITTNTLLARYNQAEMLVTGERPMPPAADQRPFRAMAERFDRPDRKGTPVDVAKLLSSAERAGKATVIPALEKRLLQSSLKPKQEQTLRAYLDSRTAPNDTDLRETIRLLMSTPEYQLT
jgi:uncharacterized protein (DUF1800 family)